MHTYIIKENDPPFIQQLLQEINQYTENIRRSHVIHKHQLQLFKCNPFKYDSLPINFYIGNLYMIKNNSIIKFITQYSAYTNEIIVCPTDQSQTHYKCLIDIININISDLSDFKNPQLLMNKDYLTSYDRNKTYRLIYALYLAKFNMYI